MDLKETIDINANRHPWETARLKALQEILGPRIREGVKVLDVGCGDGFISKSLFGHLHNKEITAVDINLSNELMRTLNSSNSCINYQSEMPEDGFYDLILLLDVIEHVEYDQSFLTGIAKKYLAENGTIIITAPAFQSLYGRHDVFLEHYRRYNLSELVMLTAACNLNVLFSGYLFFSLLFPKYVLYKLLNLSKESEGVGNWRRGIAFTNIVVSILNLDNKILITASQFGIKIPGLTGWVLCEKQ